jgi:hypothetical protein
MSENKVEVISEREEWTHTFSYSEFLCFEKRGANTFELSLRAYDALAEYGEYCDDDGEYQNPTEIDGKEVIAVEGEFIIGGDLSVVIENSSFASPSKEDVIAWLKSVHWDEAEFDKILQRLPI